MTKNLIQQLLQVWLPRHLISATAEYDRWIATMQILDIATGDFVERAGDKADDIYFVHDGLLRLFYTTPDGRDRNKAFYGPGQLTGAISAAMNGGNAPFSIQALRPCRLIRAPYQPLRDLADLDLAVAQRLLTLLAEAFVRNEQREAMLLSCNAQQRLSWLQTNEPQLLELLPQYHVASYLGVDAVTLSRLKRRS